MDVEHFKNCVLLLNRNIGYPNIDLSLVIDTSYSMDTLVSTTDEKGKSESDGLTRLDLVKHAVRTIIKALGKNDRLAIVAYATNARLVFGMSEMSDSNKAKALEVLDKMETCGQTNIWDGLYWGMRQVQKSSGMSAVFLLTDGIPNIEPPQGYSKVFSSFEKKYSRKCMINTFGFGYELNSDLLKELAHMGEGSFSFIPDASFVGTVFINAMANLRTICARDVTISAENIKCGLPITKVGDTRKVNLGFFREGLVFPFEELSNKFTLSYNDFNRNNSIEVEKKDSEVCVNELARQHTLQTLENIMNSSSLKEANLFLEEHLKFLKSLPTEEGEILEYVKDSIKEAEDQITKAISRNDWYEKWGRHYLKSLRDAHFYQICNNFKDPAVQHYGNEKFKNIRDECSELFLSIPAPEPKRVSYSSSAGFSSGSHLSHTPIDMSSYFDADGGCFHPFFKVKTENGYRKISELKKGDFVETPDGKSEIICVVVSPFKGKMTLVGKDLVTHWHPVFTGENWAFPKNISKKEYIHEGYVFNLVLDSKHIIQGESGNYVTLGHNLQDEVTKHDFFGTQKVINNLKIMNGWEEGRVKVTKEIRNGNGQVCGFE